jgi:O-antigen/teichoic acid export membrane protein
MGIVRACDPPSRRHDAVTIGREARRERVRRVGAHVSWGLVDQGFSSATNFSLTVIAGRLIGPRGLGVVFVGFSIYLFALSFQRALVTDPLVVVSARLDAEGRASAARAALTLVLAGGLVATALMVVLGVFIPGPVGHGMLLFAPWTVLTLAQDFWRALLFRDGHGAAAALNDGVWVAVMALSVPIAWWTHSEWAIVATWGLGASLGGLLGFAQTNLRPTRPGVAWRWWRDEALRLGRWLGLENLVITAQGQALIIVLAAVLGTRDLGGLRAVESVFAPMTLAGEAIALPGLPLLSRSLATSFAKARGRAIRLSAVTVGMVLAYVLVAASVRTQLLSFVFGDAFEGFSRIVLPVAAGQIVYACGSGFWLLGKAASRGRALVLARAVGSSSALALTAILASTNGLLGAAWGLALGSGIGSILIVILAARDDAPHATSRRVG